MEQPVASSSGRTGRAIVLAVDLTPESVGAAQWAMHEFYRPGDTFHLVHVARILRPNFTIQHSYHATYDIPDVGPPVNEREYLEFAKGQIKERFTDAMDALGMAHTLHLFVDSKEAPASDVCNVVFKVAEEVEAVLTVLAAHNKAHEVVLDSLFVLGSVADWATKNAKLPVIVVRSYGPPAGA